MEEEETAYHVVFKCADLRCQRLKLRRAINPLTDLSEKDLPYRLLNLVKGTNLDNNMNNTISQRSRP